MTINVTDIPRLIGELTLEEKADMCSGSDFWLTAPVERLGIPAIMVTDGPHGLRKQSDDPDHLGVGGAVPATCFPPAVTLASTWNRELIEEVGRALGAETRAESVSVLLGPGVNIKRSPLCGRNFEYFSEDPVVAGDLAAALIKGIQEQGVGTSVKHYAANNQETDRMRVSAEVDLRTLKEIYLAPFERLVAQAKPWTFMCSYNKINGTYAAHDRWLLTDVLRNEMGFDGLVMSDWGAVTDAVASVHAGLDLEMPTSRGVGAAKIVAAVKAGELDIADVDLSVTRLLTLIARSAAAKANPGSYDREVHHALARKAAAAGIVLLKNDRGLLPLATSGGTLAIIGAFATEPRYQGAGSSQVSPTRLDTGLEEIRALVDGAREVSYARGFQLDSDAPVPELTAEAVACAKDAETVVLFLGLPASYESEGFDRTHLNLPEAQTVLLDELSKLDKKIVVVLSNGSVVQATTWGAQADAIVESWLGGQSGAGAVADVLFGKVNPSGRLAETIPVRLEDTPSYLNFPGEAGKVVYGEGIYVGYRYFDTQDLQVAYPFGYGLSYTTFEHSELEVRVDESGPEISVRVSVTVTNTGAVAGQETVQLYVRDPESSVRRPAHELKGFAKVDVAPGVSERVTIDLDRRSFAFFHPDLETWVVEGGEFEIEVGASSRDIRLRGSLELAGEPIVLPIDESSTVDDWLKHPVGSGILMAAFMSGGGVGDTSGQAEAGSLGDPATLLKLLGGTPLTTFAGLGIVPIDLPAIVAALHAAS